jgi:hypothetical protein
MARRAFVFAACLLIVAAWPVGTTAAGEVPPVPCTDARGCPNLVGDAGFMFPQKSVETFDQRDCAVREGMITAGTHRLLRFTYVTLNLGPGALHVGNPTQHPEWFEYADCHHHYHFREYADYRLWTPEGFTLWDALRTNQPDKTAAQVLAEHPELSLFFVEGTKQGFCVIDIRFYPNTPGADDKTFVSCNQEGLSVGWADVYGNGLDGQWFDIGGLSPGKYVLEQEVNAERLFTETSYQDNRVWSEVLI